jgi:rhamnogalacturonyl hydrolase YesR
MPGGHRFFEGQLCCKAVMRDHFPPNNLQNAITSLLDYCRANQWAGYDPYDALNSKVFKSTPFSRSKLCRIAFTQAMKRSPINFRPLLGITKQQNPKGLAVFATALLKLPGAEVEAKEVLDLLVKSRSTDRPYACWGYNFAWQNRVTLVPRGEPNIICTTFAGNALLDAYEKYHDPEYLRTALSAAEFLLNGLHIEKCGTEICFSYTPKDREQVHNANLLGAAFLARLYQHTNNNELLGYAISAAEFTVNRQAADGSWPYGESSTQKWIDNFHTGYNLIALRRISSSTGLNQFDESIRKGFDFYKNHFFGDDGVAKYYHDRTYPIDIHAIAQSIITLVEFRDLAGDSLSVAEGVFKWAIRHMRDADGWYYFQKGPFITKKGPYMRWCQAWMLLALAVLAEASDPRFVRKPTHSHCDVGVPST